MERVDAHTHVERILSGEFDNVLVGSNASGLEGLAGKLLVLVRDQVDAKGEVVDVGLLPAQIENADLGIGHSAVEAGLGVRLVLAIPVAASRTATHSWRNEEEEERWKDD